METPKKEIPAGTDFIMTVPLNRDKSKNATFYLKDITEACFVAAKDMIAKGKSLEAGVFIIKTLRLGGDDISVFDENLIAKRSAADLVAELLEPVEGELKKN